MKFGQIASFFTLFAILCCSTNSDTNAGEIIQENSSETLQQENNIPRSSNVQAQVTNVAVRGEENNYTFNVTVSSPDTGCEQYADWWEVIDIEGNLIYRRILAHSHVNEQPFTRSGGRIAISSNTEVYIRTHMNNSSYGATVLKGNVSNGFNTANLPTDFAKELENQEPLPNGCAF